MQICLLPNTCHFVFIVLRWFPCNIINFRLQYQQLYNSKWWKLARSSKSTPADMTVIEIEIRSLDCVVNFALMRFYLRWQLTNNLQRKRYQKCIKWAAAIKQQFVILIEIRKLSMYVKNALNNNCWIMHIYCYKKRKLYASRTSRRTITHQVNLCIASA